MPSLFGTSGIRGPANTLFTPQFCFDLGRTFAIFLDQNNQTGDVAVAIDTRTSSPHIAQNLIYGLRYAGREVIHLGAIPVPAANYSILSMGVVAAIMVTGSHIDIESNGVKFFANKEEINKDQEKQISDLYQSLKEKVSPVTVMGTIPQSNRGINNYIEMLLSLVDHPLPKLKIVLDPGNGGQTEVMKTVLRELSADFVVINGQTQEQLISRDTETDDAFRALQEKVVEEKADLGVGFDSDGDRCIFVDRKGNFIPGDYSGTLIAKWHAADSVVCPVNVSNVINYIGKEVIRTRVGSPYVIAGMKKSGSNFGFESNGGCIHEDVMLSRDGGATFIKMLNILKWSKLPLHELVGELPKFYIRRSKFDCPTEKFDLILEKARGFLTSQSIDTTDGVKLILDENTWILFRPSGNAPEFRVFVESNQETKANQFLTHALSFAKQIAV
ncbi:hypothetical protein HYU90_00910 [Candidatus Collierbacteria bacterium]|nr:hypothetical protein [Candidatus Collierbacteria bacterium]